MSAKKDQSKHKATKDRSCPYNFVTTYDYNLLTNQAKCPFCGRMLPIEQTNEQGRVLLKKHIN